MQPIEREEVDHEKILEENDQIRKKLNIARVYPKIRSQADLKAAAESEKRFTPDSSYELSRFLQQDDDWAVLRKSRIVTIVVSMNLLNWLSNYVNLD